MQELFQRELLGNAFWQYGLFFIFVFGAVLLAKILDFFLGGRIKGLVKRTKTKLDDLIVEVLRRFLKLVLIVVVFRLGINIFQISPKVENIFDKTFLALLAILAIYILVRLVDLFVAYLEPRVALTKSRLDDHLLLLLRKSLKIFIIVSVTLITMEMMKIKVTSLIAGLGVGGIAIAFAARDTISNFFGSIAIFADRPFVVGDRIIVEGYEGFIESIGFRTTRIRTLEGTLVTIPNSKMVNTAINNISRRPTIRNMFTIGVTYDTGLEKMSKALEILRDVFKNHKSTENYWVYFKEYGSHSLNILVSHWCKCLKYEEFLKATEEINLEVMRRFEESKIEFAFPTQTIYLKKEKQENIREA